MQKLVIMLWALAGLMMSCTSSSLPEEPSATAKYIRHSAHSPEGQQHLQSMRVALEKMANYDSTDPRSFAYWGATHALPDADCYPNRILPNTPDALGWNTCPHMNAGDTLFHFLTWHRLLLEHFEAMVRDQSGDPTFALPYWDYENHPTLPQALQVDLPYTANTVLQITSRSPTLNLGKAIDPNYTSSIVYNDCSNNDSVKACPPNVSPTLAFVMDSDRYFAVPDAESFTAYLESGVHNVLHRYIGGRVNTLDTTLFRVASRGGQLPPPLNGVLGDLLRNNIYGSFFLNDKNRAGVCTFNPLPMGGLMGQVPSAGFDPVFWLHHSNIDRLWAMWEAQQQQSIPEAQFVGGAGRRAYTFFLPNGELDSTLYDPKDGTAPLEVVYEQSYNVSYAYQVGEDTVTIEAHNTPAMQAATTDYEGILQTQRPLEGIRDLVETVSLGALDPAVLQQSDGPYAVAVTLEVPLTIDDNVGFKVVEESCPGEAVCDWFQEDDPGEQLVGFFGIGMQHDGMHHGHSMGGMEATQEVTLQVLVSAEQVRSGQELFLAVVPFANGGAAEAFTVKEVALADL